MTVKKSLPFIFAILGGAVAFWLAWTLPPPEYGPWQLAARYTVRVSYALFLAAFLVSSLAQLFPGNFTRGLVAIRRQLGLGFALAHTVHLYALYVPTFVLGREADAITLVFGGLAYVLMFAMAATSNNTAQRALGKSWQRLHLAGIWYLWFVFAFTFAGRIGQNRVSEILLAIGVLAAGVRITTYIIRKHKGP